jgi:Tfp pilus assembly protein PilF
MARMTPSSSLRSIFFFCLIAAACILPYANTFHVPFQFDDLYNIIQKPYVRDIGMFFGRQPIEPDFAFLMRPVAYFTFAVNYWIGGAAVVGYHVVNVFIHLCNGFLVYLFVLLTFRTPYVGKFETRSSKLETEGRAIALSTALLFAVHPIQTEAVTYIVQRLASLAALFYLLSLVTYVKWRLTTHESNPSLPPLGVGGGEVGLPEKQRFLSPMKRFSLYAISLLSAVLAMKTKEISFTLPLTICFYEFLFFDGPVRKRFFRLVPFLLAMLIIPVELLRLERPAGEIIGDLSKAMRVETVISRWNYLLTEFRVIVTYIRLLFFPVNQNLDYDYPVYRSFLDPNVFLSFLFLLSLFGAAVYLLYRSRVTPPSPPYLREGNKEASVKGRTGAVPPLKLRGGGEGLWAVYARLVALGIFWFFTTLAVESSVIPIADVIFEHRLYLPSVGFFLAVTAGGFAVWRRVADRPEGKSLSPDGEDENNPPSSPLKVTPPPSAPPLKIRGGRGSYDLEGEQRGGTGVEEAGEGSSSANEHLGQHGMKWPKKIAAAALALIVIALSGVTYARNKIWRSEISLWEDVVSKSPKKVRALSNLGHFYGEKGRLDEAIREYHIALGLAPDDYQVHNNLGVVYKAQGRLGEAIAEYLTAARLNPDDPMAHYNLGNIYREQGNFEEAVRQYQTAVRLDPGVAVIHNNLGLAYEELGDKKDAERQYRAALELEPDYDTARRNLQDLLRGGR